MDSFLALRRGLRDHIRRGCLCPTDLGIYTYIHFEADWSTGIFTGCALSIAYGFNDPNLKECVQKSLRRLRDRHYINYPKGDGSRGSYPILINKYEITVGDLSGRRLNAWKHGERCQPEYEQHQNGRGTVPELSSNGSRTVKELSGELPSTCKDGQLYQPKREPQNGHGTVEEQWRNSEGTVEKPILDVLDILDVQDSTPSSEQKGHSDQVSVSRSKKTATAPSREASQLAALLKDEILRNAPKFKITQQQERNWATVADLMLRRDRRPEDEIAELIRWVQHDEFWRSNILSMGKLREKYDQLQMKQTGSNSNGKLSTAPKADLVEKTKQQEARFASAGGGK